MITSDERRRNNPRPRPKHRFDKQLIVINQATNNSTATTVVYPAAVFPSVCMGVVVSGASSTTAGANVPFTWALVVVPQGTAISAISSANLTSLYTPETFVMAFGAGTLESGAIQPFLMKTKTGRKINAGDTIQFTVTSSTANACQHTYCVQFFLKT